MADDDDRLGRTARQAEAWAAFALTALVLAHTVDAVTGGRLRAAALTGWARFTAPPPRRRIVPTPEEVTAVLSEATRITRGAVNDG